MREMFKCEACKNKNMKIVHLIHTCDNIFIEEKVNCGPPELSLKMRVDGHHNVRNLHLLRLDEPAYNWFALWSRTAQVKCFIKISYKQDCKLTTKLSSSYDSTS